MYKLVTGEEWYVYIQLDKAMAEELAETTYIKTRIDKDNETVWADFSILQIDENYYGKLLFDNSMIRYAGDRFLNIELITEQESGLRAEPHRGSWYGKRMTRVGNWKRFFRLRIFII